MNLMPQRPRPLSLVLLVVLLLTVLAGCSPPEPIRIGFLGNISGRGADLGIAGRDGVQLAVERINQQGGISGRRIELLVRDDRQDAETASKAVQEMIDQGVVAIVGPMTSVIGTVVAPLVSRHRIPMISPTVTTEELTGKDDSFFRVTSTTRVFASRNARYHLEKNKMRRVAAVYDLGNRTFTESWLQQFRAAFEAGGGVIERVRTFTSGQDVSYLDLARELLAGKPDGILIVANSMDSAYLCQQIRKLDQAIAITLADWGATERLLELGGRAVEGVSVVQTFDRNSLHPDYLNYRSAYLDRFKREPGFPGVYAFDAVQVIFTALARWQKGTDLKETILAVREFEGLQGPFAFDQFGDVKRPHVSMSVVRDGQFVVLE